MKGIVFTEFLEMVESKFGPDIADRMIVDSALPSGGVYTSVGTYDHKELVAMVMKLSAISALAPNVLVNTFGTHLFGRFSTLYPRFFEGISSSFAFLRNVESYIHPEVRKLYPDAELPHFDTRDIDANTLELVYRSNRHFGDLAEGLIQGCILHFGDKIKLHREPCVAVNGQDAIRFTLSKAA